MEMVSPDLAGGAIAIHARGGKDPLPHPLASCVRILPEERVRQLDPAGASGQIGLVLPADVDQMCGERHLDHRREHGDAVLVALAATYGDLVRRQVDVLDAEATALEYA
jgi:hypothetical protein